MFFTNQTIHWSLIINYLIQNGFENGLTICILWNSEMDWSIENIETHTLVHINREFLNTSCEENAYDFDKKRIELDRRGIAYDELILKLIISIEFSFCEAFIAFQNDILPLADAFVQASTYSDWTSLRNQFIFGYFKEGINKNNKFLKHELFRDHPNIIVIEAATYNSSVFKIQTNRFSGPLNETSEKFDLLDVFDAVKGKFPDLNKLKSTMLNKIVDLRKREIVISGFDYRPFVALDYELQPQIYDRSNGNPRKAIHADGTELRVLITYCELHNCIIEFDSSEDDWGYVYENGTGFGLFGMVKERRIDISMDAFYNIGIMYVDSSAFLGRSGVTCVVPAPQRLVSWQLPLLPFQKCLWLSFLLFLAFEIFILFISLNIEQSLVEHKKTNWFRNFGFAYAVALKPILSQSSTYHATTNFVRSLIFSYYMVDIVITAIYGAGLATILTLPIMSEAPDSVERMSKFNLKWTGQTPLWIHALKNADDPLIQNLISNYHVMNVEEMRKAAESRLDLGFIVERLTFGHFGNAEYLTMTALHRLKLMIDDIYYEYTLAITPRCWAFEDSFNQFIYWWHSGGFDKFWESKISAKYLNKFQQGRIETSKYIKLDNGPNKLDLENIVGFIIIWTVGIILSILTFLLELMIGKRG